MTHRLSLWRQRTRRGCRWLWCYLKASCLCDNGRDSWCCYIKWNPKVEKNHFSVFPCLRFSFSKQKGTLESLACLLIISIHIYIFFCVVPCYWHIKISFYTITRCTSLISGILSKLKFIHTMKKYFSPCFINMFVPSRFEYISSFTFSIALLKCVCMYITRKTYFPSKYFMFFNGITKDFLFVIYKIFFLLYDRCYYHHLLRLNYQSTCFSLFTSLSFSSITSLLEIDFYD